MRSLANSVGKTAILIKKSFRTEKIKAENLDLDMYKAAEFYLERLDPETAPRFLYSVWMQYTNTGRLTVRQAAAVLNFWRSDLLRADRLVHEAREIASRQKKVHEA